MKIIITGGAGFIASHIADAYIKKGHTVVLIDNLVTGFKRNINPKAKFYNADIRNVESIERIFKKEKPEIVCHYAAIVEVIKSIIDPNTTYEVNILGTSNVARLFGKYGVGRKKKFIFASSGGTVYGNAKNIPTTEDEPTIPESPYGLSKLLGEEFVTFYARQFGFNYCIFRYPNVYGPRQNPKGEAGVTAIFAGLMKKGERPTIFGDGKKMRDYVFVEDIVRANMLALSRGENVILNIGSGKPTSDRDIFDIIVLETRFFGEPIYAPHRKGEAYIIALSAKRAKRVLGWRPTIHVKEGICRVVRAL